MGMPVVLTGICKCQFGTIPTPLVVFPFDMVTAKFLPVATVMDHIPFLNILPFGLCTNLANPMVAAATAAALGVFTPMPCIPITTNPWIPIRPTVMVKNKPVLTETSCVMCQWGGPIQILFPGVSLCIC